MREIVNVHVGQCGNQIGYNFWEAACQEHSIQADLTLKVPEMAQYTQTYFEDIDNSRYVPRSVMVDLEPGVLNNIQTMAYGAVFNPENMISAQDGAGNRWSSGFYSNGSDIIDEVMESVRK